MDDFFIYSYKEVFQLQNRRIHQIGHLKKYKNEIPMEMWKDFLKCIFQNDDVTRRS